jgi:type IV pilus assembly protein PilX
MHPQFNPQAPFQRSGQRGAVLAVALLMLAVLTLLALGASQATRTYERTAIALRDRDTAFQTAEATLRAAERLLASTNFVDAVPPCESERCQVYPRGAIGDDLLHKSVGWWKRYGWIYNSTGDWVAPMGSTTEQPGSQFVVEIIESVPDSMTIDPVGPVGKRTYYRVTAISRAGPSSAPVVLQSIYSRRFN